MQTGKDGIDIPKITPPKRSLLWRLFKVISIVTLLCVILLVILFYIFPPMEMIRKGAEYAASNILGVEVSIDSLYINPLKGFKIKGIKIAKKEPQIFSVKEIIFDYDFKRLWEERVFVINTLHIDTPKIYAISENGVWNFEPILKKFAGAGKLPPKPKEAEKVGKDDADRKGIKIALPHIPIRVELKDIRLSNAEAIFKQEDKLFVHYRGLNIKLSGEIDNTYNRFLFSLDSEDREGENLSVAFNDKSLSFNIHAPLSFNINAEEDNLEIIKIESKISLPIKAKIGDHPSSVLNISTDVSASVSLKEGALDIAEAMLKIDDNKLFLTGSIKDILHIPIYDIKISDSKFSLGDIYKKIKDYLPKNLEVINIKGDLIIPSIHVKGAADYKNARYPVEMSSDIELSAVDIDIPLLNFKLGNLSLSSLNAEGVVSLKDKMHSLKLSGAIALSDLNILLPKFGISAAGINISSDIKQMEIKGVLPVYVDTTSEFSAKKIDWRGEYILSDIKDSLSVNAKGDIFSKNLVKNDLSFKIDSIIPKLGERIKLDVSSKTVLSAKTKSGDIVITELLFNMKKTGGAGGDIFSLKGGGSVTSWGKRGFNIDADIRKFDIEKSVSIIPPQILKELGVFPYKGEGDVKIKVSGRIPTKEEIEGMSIPVDIALSVNMSGVDMVIEKGLGIDIKDLDFALDLSHKNMGDIAFDGDISIGRADKRGAVAIGGGGAIKIKGTGRIPKKDEIDKFAVPIDITSSVKLTGVDISLEDKGIKINNLNLSADASHKNMGDVALDGDISIGGMHKEGGISKGLSGDIKGGAVSFSLRLDELNILTLENVISSTDLGVENKISGKISGLNSVLMKRALPSIKDILKEIMTDISVSTNVDLSKLKGVITGLPEGVKIDGEIKQYAQLQLIPNKFISISGGINLSGVDMANDKIILSDVRGDIPFKKGLSISPVSSPVILEDEESWRKGFFANIRPYSEHFKNLSIKDISYKGFNAHGIDMDINFNEDSLSIDKFMLDIFGGSSGGSLYLKSKKGGEDLSLNLEYAEIDLSRLLKDAALLDDARIDGNVNIDTGLTFKGDKIDMDHMVLYINITKIGDAAFDALLKSLDPEESKPAIMNARSALKYASPYMVAIKIKNGLLSVKLKMKSKVLNGKIIDIPAIERIQFASILNLNLVTDTINSLGWIKGVLRYVAATSIEDILPSQSVTTNK